MRFRLWLWLKPSLAGAVCFFVAGVVPVMFFAVCVLWFARLILPTAHPRVWLIIAGLCTSWLLADKVLSKGGGR